MAVLALASTLHDPEGRLLPLLRRHAAGLAAYAAVVVAATDHTRTEVRRALAEAGARVVAGSDRIGGGRRAALAAAAGAGAAVLACDFDRWLFWRETEPEELAALLPRAARRSPRPWYVCLGRTRRAFAAHPEAQRLAEGATNRALSLRVGRRLDATAGAALLFPPAVGLVLRASIEPTNATDLEWPALVHAADPRRLTGLRCDGLAFETPAFFADEIAAAGSVEAWVRHRYDRPGVWAARLRLAADSVAALDRILGAPDDRVRR